MKFPGQMLDSLSNGKNWLSFGSNQDNCHLPAITENILCPKCTISQYAMLLLSTEVWVYLLPLFQVLTIRQYIIQTAHNFMINLHDLTSY